jgi:hypothetical protein
MNALAQTVLIGYGSVNFSAVSASFATFVVRPTFDRTVAGKAGRPAGNKQVAQAGQFQHQGALINQMTLLDNGTVLLITSRWTRSGAPVRDGAVFLRLRVGAAYVSIASVVPTHAHSVCGDRFNMFAGNADLLGSDDLEVAGIQPPSVYVQKFMQQEEINECFEITEMVPEAEPAPATRVIEVLTPSGVEERRVESRATGRRIVLPRRK